MKFFDAALNSKHTHILKTIKCRRVSQSESYFSEALLHVSAAVDYAMLIHCHGFL